MRIGGQHAVHQHLGLTCHRVLHRLHAALVGHIHPFGAGDAGQLHAGQMGSTARCGDGKVQVLLLGQLHQLLEIAGLDGGVHHQHMGRIGQHGCTAQRLGRIEAELGIDGGRDGQRAEIAEQPGIAVGRCTGDELSAQIAIGAGLVVDHHGLLELLGDQLPDGARNDVGAAAGRIGNDQADGLAGPGIGSQQCGRQQTACRQGQQRAQKVRASDHGEMSPCCGQSSYN
ncbi:hypothetical protein SDC9_161057 [bioreactor metagenome]|uniref:Uncharacterized protein n=1 Tax=bioreactor metagenome TaxID=1076179 RepID=A0A645FNG5_9ZZZZ